MLVVLVIVSIDTGVDNIENNVTELTNSLDSKNFSHISDLEDQIVLLKNSSWEKNAERLFLAFELKQFLKK